MIDPALEDEEALYQEAVSQLRSPKPQSASLVFIVLFVLFLVGQLSDLKSLTGVAILVGVILFHEAGHALGMRLFGFRDVRMFFIPFFGAAVSGRPRGVSASKEALVSLFGPLPGIVLSVVLLLACAREPDPLLSTIARVGLFINAFNLLPFGGLDGGRFFQRVIFSRHRVLEILFQAVGSLLLVWLSVSLELWLLLAFACFGLMMLPFRWRLLKAAADVREAFPSLETDPERLDELQTSWLFNQARAVLQGKARDQPTPLANIMEQMLEAAKPAPGALATLGLLGLYVFALVCCVLGVALMLAASH